MFPGFSDPPGYRTVKTLQSGALDQLRARQQRRFANVTWGQLVEEGYIIAGGPDTVAEKMEEMIKGLRVGHVFCLLHNGNQPAWKTRHSSELFASKVMPRLRDVWADYEGDDRWWIKPYDGRVDPTAAPAGEERR